MADKFDRAAENVARKFGFASVPWWKVTIGVLAIYSVCSCLVLFFRPDFINLTVCIVGIYVLLNTNEIRKWTFRMLVLGIFISMLYDVLWFYLNHSEYMADLKHDGGIEKSVRYFSLIMSYFSFFWRVILCF